MIMIDIEMPENCWGCPCFDGVVVFCGARPAVDGVYVSHKPDDDKGRPDWCPLSEMVRERCIKTYFDRITESPEALAEFITNERDVAWVACDSCGEDQHICPCLSGMECYKNFAAWLNQEVKNDE